MPQCRRWFNRGSPSLLDGGAPAALQPVGGAVLDFRSIAGQLAAVATVETLAQQHHLIAGAGFQYQLILGNLPAGLFPLGGKGVGISLPRPRSCPLRLSFVPNFAELIRDGPVIGL